MASTVIQEYGSMTVHPKRLLLVEDNRIHAKLIAAQISSAAHPANVEWVQDGEQALERLSGPAPLPDMILLDLKLPKLDGHEVLRHIKHSERLQFIPVVMITTSEREEDMQIAYEEHVNGYLVKPTDFAQMRSMIVDTVAFWCGWNRLPRP
jgi:CheY-like chemotaxis protein